MKDNYTNLVKKQTLTTWFSLLFWSGHIGHFWKHRPVFRFNSRSRKTTAKKPCFSKSGDFHFNRG